jgi:hypothetical protein
MRLVPGRRLISGRKGGKEGAGRPGIDSRPADAASKVRAGKLTTAATATAMHKAKQAALRGYVSENQY